MASNTEVAHNWANQTGRKCNGSNFYYDGQMLYSYGSHFVVGAITSDGRTALLNNRSYSNSTAKHQIRAREATSHLNRIYCAYPEEAIRGRHENNLVVWQGEAKALMRKDTSRCNLHKLVEELARPMQSAVDYCLYFNIQTPSWVAGVENFIRGVMAFPKWERENELETTKAERKAAAEAKMIEERLAKFRAGEISYVSSSTQYLRLNGDNVCTSLGVCIPIREFMLHYNRLIHKENLLGSKVNGSYTILSVTDQFVKIGCHTISRDEIESVANQINKTTND